MDNDDYIFFVPSPFLFFIFFLLKTVNGIPDAISIKAPTPAEKLNLTSFSGIISTPVFQQKPARFFYWRARHKFSFSQFYPCYIISPEKGSYYSIVYADKTGIYNGIKNPGKHIFSLLI